MKKVLWGLVFAGFSALSAQAQDFTVPVSPEFWEGEISYTDNLSSIYLYRWTAVPAQGGRIAVCGIGYYRDSSVRSVVRRMARGGTFYVNDQETPLDLSFFAQVNSRAQMEQGTANCVITEVSGSGVRTVGLGFARGRAN